MNAMKPVEAPEREEREEAPISRFDSSFPTEPPPRRASPRYAVELDVNLGSQHNFYAGFVENMSVGGVFVATHMIKPVGEEVEFAIHLPDNDIVVRGIGEVRWIREYSEQGNMPPGMGVRFVHLEPASAEAIEVFLSQREPLFFDDE